MKMSPPGGCEYTAMPPTKRFQGHGVAVRVHVAIMLHTSRHSKLALLQGLSTVLDKSVLLVV